MDTEMKNVDEQVAPITGEHSVKEPSATWNSFKHREECEYYRTKLRDQAFNPSEFGDPLDAGRSAKKSYARTFPEGTEERMRAVVAKYQADTQ